MKWWDLRKFSEPVEVLILDPCKEGTPDLERAHGSSCLEFEPTVPTKFMVGTDRGETTWEFCTLVTLNLSIMLGCVFSCNKKSKGPSERIGAIYNAHFGPVYALQRNPCFPKVLNDYRPTSGYAYF